jgi:competence ComEA-like helix-hairpin-helix protein
MSWREDIAAYFRFTRKDRVAALFLLFVLLGVYFLPRLFPKTAGTGIKEDTALSRMVDSATQLASIRKPYTETNEREYAYEVFENTPFTEHSLFPFDPNTLPEEGWQRLGLRPRTTKTILNYRSKGGRFYKPEDLKKIWGLPAGFYERVQAYIRIPAVEKEASPNNFKNPYEKKERTLSAININTADTGTLIALPGIGSKLASRIVAFREKLGGFYSVTQLSETYGLPDSTFQKLKPRLQVHGDLKKWNINTASKDELKTHPYIKWQLANLIVEYRAQHGLFKKLDELKNIMLIDEATYNKIVPYLTIE